MNANAHHADPGQTNRNMKMRWDVEEAIHASGQQRVNQPDQSMAHSPKTMAMTKGKNLAGIRLLHHLQL